MNNLFATLSKSRAHSPHSAIGTIVDGSPRVGQYTDVVTTADEARQTVDKISSRAEALISFDNYNFVATESTETPNYLLITFSVFLSFL